jgi:hypothetical protein
METIGNATKSHVYPSEVPSRKWPKLTVTLKPGNRRRGTCLELYALAKALYMMSNQY